MYKCRNAQNQKSTVAGDFGLNKSCALVYTCDRVACVTITSNAVTGFAAACSQLPFSK